MNEWKQYKRKGLSELLPVEKFETLEGISVSEEDRKNGSPKAGDMIARNPKNHDDKWLVAKEYFEDNLEPAQQHEQNSEDLHCEASTGEENIYYVALDEMMIAAHIGTADGCETVFDVMKKINELITWNISAEEYFKNEKINNE